MCLSGPGWPNWDHHKSASENVDALVMGTNEAKKYNRPELVISYKVGSLLGVRQPVVVQFNEADDYPKTCDEIREAGASLVVFHHANDVPQYRYVSATCPTVQSLVHIPHSAETAIYHDYGVMKDIDVLCAGNMSQQFYPFRNRLKNIAYFILRKRGYRVVILKHPGYTLPARDGTVVGIEFARMLNRAKLVFTCSMRFKYALAKYSEIALCRSLAVGDIPDERQEFFKQTILNVEPHMTDDEIVRIVEEYLDDDAKRKSLTDTAYDLTQRSYTMDYYAERFLAATRGLFDVR